MVGPKFVIESNNTYKVYWRYFISQTYFAGPGVNDFIHLNTKSHFLNKDV